jgi:hypothetical protein
MAGTGSVRAVTSMRTPTFPATSSIAPTHLSREPTDHSAEKESRRPIPRTVPTRCLVGAGQCRAGSAAEDDPRDGAAGCAAVNGGVDRARDHQRGSTARKVTGIRHACVSRDYMASLGPILSQATPDVFSLKIFTRKIYPGNPDGCLHWFRLVVADLPGLAWSKLPSAWHRHPESVAGMSHFR